MESIDVPEQSEKFGEKYGNLVNRLRPTSQQLQLAQMRFNILAMGIVLVIGISIDRVSKVNNHAKRTYQEDQSSDKILFDQNFDFLCPTKILAINFEDNNYNGTYLASEFINELYYYKNELDRCIWRINETFDWVMGSCNESGTKTRYATLLSSYECPVSNGSWYLVDSNQESKGTTTLSPKYMKPEVVPLAVIQKVIFWKNTSTGESADCCKFGDFYPIYRNIKAKDCASTCVLLKNCTHYDWTSTGRYCYLRDGPVTRENATYTGDVFTLCGILNRTV